MGRAKRFQRRVWKEHSMQKECVGNRKWVIGCLRNGRKFKCWRVDQMPWLKERMVRKVKAGKAKVKEQGASLKGGHSSLS